jgi:ribosomal protein S18 acetylase RimI-like enzyme
MIYHFENASESNRAWLEELRRAANYDLFIVTFGTWDEQRHQRHCDECWNEGEISLVVVGGSKIGMIQLFQRADEVEVGEIQIHPDHQNQKIGTQLLEDVVAEAHQEGKSVVLSVGLKNENAHRLYNRLGFDRVGQNDTHLRMRYLPPRRTRR